MLFNSGKILKIIFLAVIIALPVRVSYSDKTYFYQLVYNCNIIINNIFKVVVEFTFIGVDLY
ncbi:hypothetical protein ABSA28_00848 [Candidatus Hepatincolaceae symbiont of Richtersius coronifer]